MKRIAIIGGGISGLSAAFYLQKQKQAGVPLEYVLFEASPRFGGVIRSERIDSCLVEAGPDSFLTEKASAAELCVALGLGDQLIGSNDLGRKTYILVNGELTPIPDGLAFMVPTKILPSALSPLFSFRTKIKMAREWFRSASKVETDESVASFVERHYGAEMVERLADPLLSGIYGGDAHNLSLKAVLPRFADMQAAHGSLSKAMILNRTQAIKNKNPPRPLFTTLKGGMQQMVDGILHRLPEASLRPNSPVESLRFENQKWKFSARDQTQEFEELILATPAHVAAALLNESHAELAAELRGIQYSSSVTVCLGYDQTVRAQLPAGFGYLAPRSEHKRVMAATFVHNKFPQRAPEDRALIRCFLGGTRDEAILDLSGDEIVQTVRSELRQVLKIQTEPLFSRVYKWPKAMAQYNVGHLEKLAQIRKLQPSGLLFTGNAYNGIGVPDCVRAGKEAAIRYSADTFERV
jgi:oxygen-dependent protoporphyrinogen oxidase